MSKNEFIQPKTKRKAKQPKEKKSAKFDFTKFIQPIRTNHKVQFALLIGAIIIIFTIAGSVVFFGSRQNTDTDENGYAIDINEYSEDGHNGEKPLTMPRKIDGLTVATADANKVPVCVMIENMASADVRPQAGLSAASVIYEVIVEGGITRFMAVFAGEEADPVGPVRSARDTYLEFAAEIDCMYTHAGGSYTAMLSLQENGYKDLDALRESKYFWRVSDRANPHNLFTKTENLYQAVTEGHSWNEEPKYDSWKFKDASEERINAGEEGYVSEVNINFGGSYDVTYIYNPDDNNYKRENGGYEHVDKNTGDVLTTNNIIIQKVGSGWAIEGKGRINFPVTGEGEVYIFREGEMVQGTWKKEDRLARTKYYDAENNEIELLRGNSWVEIVPEDRTFDWK